MVIVCQYCLNATVRPDFIALHQDRCYSCGATSTRPTKVLFNHKTCGHTKCKRYGQCPADCKRWTRSQDLSRKYHQAEMFSEEP